jgi:hypothetical protein
LSPARALPDQPSLRYLKLEAKRRLSAGEFGTLHDAQLAIAREHGQPSWTALKRLVEAGPGPALARARWVISRFRGAGTPGWAAPGDAELREHFHEHYLRVVPASTMARQLTLAAGRLHDSLAVIAETPLSIRAEISGLRLEATAEAAPPYRLTLLRLYPLGQRVTDARVSDPPVATAGTVPGPAAQVTAESCAELGLPGLVVAGSDAVTIRELLTHTGGVVSPAAQFARRVPSLVSLTGPVAACGGPRGTFAASHGGYALLGQLIADVTGLPYPEAAAALVLGPLGMASSSFPASWPDDDGAVTGYRLAEDGTFRPAPAEVSTLPAAAGLWSTAPDLVRFGLGWASLLPRGPAREAVRAQAAQREGGPEIGLGWLLNRPRDASGQAGLGPAAAASLIVAPGSGRVSVAMTSRLVPIEPVNARLVRPVA